MYTHQLYQTLKKILETLEEGLPIGFFSAVKDVSNNGKIGEPYKQSVARALLSVRDQLKEFSGDKNSNLVLTQLGLDEIINEKTIVEMVFALPAFTALEPLRISPVGKKIIKIADFCFPF